MRPAFQNRDHFVQPTGKNVGPVRLLARQAEMPAHGVPRSALGELPVVRDENSALFLLANCLVVVRGEDHGLRDRPGVMPGGPREIGPDAGLPGRGGGGSAWLSHPIPSLVPWTFNRR